MVHLSISINGFGAPCLPLTAGSRNRFTPTPDAIDVDIYQLHYDTVSGECGT